MLDRAHWKKYLHVGMAMETEDTLRCIFHDPLKQTDVMLLYPKAIGDDFQKLAEFIEALRRDTKSANVTKSIEDTLRNICGEWGNYQSKYGKYDKAYLSKHSFKDRAELKAYLGSYQKEALSAIRKAYGIRFYHLPTEKTKDKMLDTFLTKMEKKVRMHQQPIER